MPASPPRGAGLRFGRAEGLSFPLFDQSVTAVTDVCSVRLYNPTSEYVTFGLGGGNERTSDYPIIRTGPGCDRHRHHGAERLRVLDAGVSPFCLPRR
jgi:hypothetical protein